MDRNRDGGEGLMVRERRALTLLVERKVLALTLNPRMPIATLFSSLRGGAAASSVPSGTASTLPGQPDEGSLAMGSSSDGATSVRRGAIPTAKRRRLSGPRSRSTCN